jgi:hypothetical protein
MELDGVHSVVSPLNDLDDGPAVGCERGREGVEKGRTSFLFSMKFVY